MTGDIAHTLIQYGIDNQGGGSAARPLYFLSALTPAQQQEEEEREAIAIARWWYAESLDLVHTPAEWHPEDTPALWYAKARGISHALADTSGLRFHPDYLHNGPALVFPVLDQAGVVTAVQGRFLFSAPIGSGRPDKQSCGKIKYGVFCTAGALDQREIIVTEAPLDALALAECGFPAIALLGTSYPAWLPGAIGARHVWLAMDNDIAGDTAALTLSKALQVNGGTVPDRLKPKGVKDRNEYLVEHGPVVMEEAIIAAAFPERPGVLWLADTCLRDGVSVMFRDGTRATVLQDHDGPEPGFPAGWTEIQTSDGRRGKVDCRYVNDEPGAGFDDVLSWRERIDQARDELVICESLYMWRLERNTDLMIEKRYKHT